MWTRTSAFLLALILAVPIGAASITAVADGYWSETSTWSSGTVPVAGDAVATAGYTVTATNGSTIYGAITVGASSALYFDGAVTVDSTLTINGSGAAVFVNYGAAVTFDDDVDPLVTITTGTMTINGRVLAGTNSEGTADESLISVGAAGVLNVQGRSLNQTLPISGLDITAQTTADNLVVTVDGVPDASATHARLVGGTWDGMIWPVSISGSTVTLDGALAQVYNAANLVVEATSGADSVSVVDSAATPNEQRIVGSSIIYDGGVMAGVVEHVRNSATASQTVLFTDRTFNGALIVTTEAYILTWGVDSTTKLEFLQLAQIWGADDEPSTDNTVGGTASTGKDECHVAFTTTSTATLNFDYFEVRWGGGDSTAWGALVEASVTADFDNGLFYQPAAASAINIKATAQTTFDAVWMYNALGPDTGTYGGFLRGGESGDGQDLVARDGGAIGTLWNFITAAQGGTYATSRNVHSDWGSGSFIDTGAKTYANTHTDDVVYGSGHTPFDYGDNNTAGTLTIDGARTYSGGNAQNQNTLGDGSYTHSANYELTYGSFDISGDVGAVTVKNSRFEWSHIVLGRISTDVATDTTRVTNCTFENFGFWASKDTTTVSLVPGDIGLGGLYLSCIVTTGASNIVLDGCRFINPWRRGPDLSGVLSGNSRLNLGAQIRGNNSAAYVDWRRCYWNADQSIAEGLQINFGNNANSAIYTDNSNWTGGGVSYSFFDGIPFAINVWRASGGHNIPIHHNLFITGDTTTGGAGRALQLRNSTSGGTVNFNTFIDANDNNTQNIYVYSGVTNLSMVGNLIIDGQDNFEQVRFFDTTAADAADLQYNNFAIYHDHAIYDGTATQTVATAETAYGWTNNVATYSSATNWQAIVTSLTVPRLLAGGSARNMVTGYTDADGTVADAGYLALLAKGFGW